ncbi:uncharacterized protein [Oryza sativa Japonica Group]|uniref:Ankyrin 3, epithelial isoform a-like n=3 Tax=Oryza sativa subsp. japonica TaxID=39947 RepID=A0A0P0VIN3_ORYSJ|nr:ankyrin-3 [Oryza sativa Japonica Group]KAB8087171.1 hypothetical protein EE612_011140 [Oryza sativa]KAF2944671.1 hypothetical protein DAI22_02g160100 [Oryza sativa Japonica Group]BAD19968.1 ankyrin 3, epithelial isoform a-like [Oryza sativa Japonica Group]BAD20008.1 ankyrin 3, epithelial isoform a-like [Oryza sativa Japonica Group]BAF08692.1 Os02g0457500 [Oryza sativa Japonica Group]|eukprot:NP_001046778.1 Os02g0457500 [Oryza sativa Japonica Group]
MSRRRAAAVAAAAREEEEASPAQRLVEAALRGDVVTMEACLAAAAAAAAADDDTDDGVPAASRVGVARLRVRCAEVALREEAAGEVIVESRELKTDVSPLFAAAHAGHAEVVRTLLVAGADVNQKLFLGYATTAAAREGNIHILEMLLQAGVTREACEDSLSEAALFAEAEAVRLLVCSEMIQPEAAAHALVTASSRGFDDVVVILLQNGVDVNSMARVLLRSVKPALHANVNCTPLVAAVMSRQISTVKLLIEEGSYLDCLVQVGSWCWDSATGEELRVGACLGEKYNAIWCAVEYYECSGEILKLLLDKAPWLLETPRKGRNLLCHAILCQNPNAVSVLLNAGANPRFPIMMTNGTHVSYPIHFAARLGHAPVLKQLMLDGANINAQTSTGDTPLMVSARCGHSDCFLELIKSGADLGIVNNAGDTAIMLAKKSSFSSTIIDILSRALSCGGCITSSDITVFSPLHFFAASDSAEALLMTLHYSAADLNRPDGSGLTPVMVAAESGHADIFRLLVMAGADIAATSAEGKSAMSIIRSRAPETRDRFEQILLQASLADAIAGQQPSFRPLHYAARIGDTSSLTQLLKMGHDPNAMDEDGYTPLMHAAAAGKLEACRALVSRGGAADAGSETALSVARRSGRSNKATEEWLLDHVARAHVLAGEELTKHTRGGRGPPHRKAVRMMRSGVLTWGATRRRNVACREARAGPSAAFRRNRRIIRTGSEEQLILMVETVTGREIHFEATSASSVELWVRGINLIVQDCAWSRPDEAEQA